MKQIRPKFTLAHLLLLTAIVAMGIQLYRNQLRFRDWEAHLALHSKVYAQISQVRKCELALQAEKDRLRPEVQVAEKYRLIGFDDQLLETTDATSASFAEFQMPVGMRRKLAQVRNAELQLRRAQAILQDLELELSHHTTDALRRRRAW